VVRHRSHPERRGTFPLPVDAGVLVYAGRNAPAWLTLVAPDALELAVTIGTRPVSQTPDSEDGDSPSAKSGVMNKEAQVLSTALELALVVLDASLDIDGGRILD